MNFGEFGVESGHLCAGFTLLDGFEPAKSSLVGFQKDAVKRFNGHPVGQA